MTNPHVHTLMAHSRTAFTAQEFLSVEHGRQGMLGVRLLTGNKPGCVSLQGKALWEMSQARQLRRGKMKMCQQVVNDGTDYIMERFLGGGHCARPYLPSLA